VSRGKKLDIFIGADIQDGWSKVEQIETKQQKLKLKPLGCGGTCKDGYIELQGDVQDLLKAKFKKLGFN